MRSIPAPGASLHPLAVTSLTLALGGCLGYIATEDQQPAPPGAAPGTAVLSGKPAEKTAPVPGAPGGSPAAPGPVADGVCTGPKPGRGVVRRLNRAEYDRTLEDLLGDTSRPASAFPPDTATLGFDNIADNLNVEKTLAARMREATAAVAERATADLTKLLGCPAATLARAEQDACLDRFIPPFGLRAWRRPLTTPEVERLRGVFRRIRDAQGVREGVSTLIAALLESPHFLFRIEGAAAAPWGQDFVRLGPYETASRLSYFLWGGMPDEELFDAAARGALATREQVAAQARRMLADKRAALAVERFFSAWLDLGKIENSEATAKHATTFATFTPAVRAGLKAETLALASDLFWKGDGKHSSFLLAGHTFVDATLARFYRATGSFSAELRRADTLPGEHAGILTQGSVMAAHAGALTSSPVLRGRFVQERLLCNSPPPPPPNVDVAIPPPDPRLTTRQRFERHRTAPACGGCHQLLDPIGLAFENFDAVGRWRTDENGLRIDASGEVFGTDVAGPFVGPRALAERLARSRQSTDCVATNWFRYAHGRIESEGDACVLRALQDGFAASGGDMRALVVALTQSDAFLFRATR